MFCRFWVLPRNTRKLKIPLSKKTYYIVNGANTSHKLFHLCCSFSLFDLTTYQNDIFGDCLFCFVLGMSQVKVCVIVLVLFI